MIVIGADQLAAFRTGLTGEAGLHLRNEGGGRLLINLPVGVGKSR